MTTPAWADRHPLPSRPESPDPDLPHPAARRLRELALWSWRRLPAGVRRRAVVGLAGRLAPRPDLCVGHSDGPVIVAGSLRARSGLGEAARLTARAFANAGHDVAGIDFTSDFDHGPLGLDPGLPDGRGLHGPGILVLQLEPRLAPLALLRLGRRFLAGKRVVGYWVWELSSLPPQWRPAFDFVHEIWTPSRFSAVAFARACDLPVRVVPHPVAPPDPAVAARARRRRDGEFRVVTAFNMASGFARKNPLAAVRAFRDAFGDAPDCRLVVRAQRAHVWPEGLARLRAAIGGAPNIELRTERLDRKSFLSLVADGDVFLSTHRSEGFGLMLAEAMRLGRVVVATGWSGNTDFMTPDNSCPLGYRLVPVADPQGKFRDGLSHWAEVDHDDAVATLRRLRDDPDLCARLGRRAVRDSGTLFDGRAFAAVTGGVNVGR